MLSETKMMIKLEEYASLFNGAMRRKEYGKARNLYNMAHTTAVVAELNEANMKRLFGDWDSDDGTETDTAKDEGLFRRWMVDEVNWKCCIERHQAYEDMACRRLGEPEGQYYSDPDYCARCEMHKKRVAPPR